MADYHIRKYKDEDFKVVCDMLVRGVAELGPALVKYSLKLPQTRLFLLAVPLTVFMAFKSFLLSSLTLASLLGFIWYGSNDFYNAYIYRYLKEDTTDIQQSFMQKPGACLWLAESNGEILGMVAAEPCNGTDGLKEVNMTRMSVSSKHRGRGISKALCRTVMDFAREQGYDSIVLETTIVQYAALKLYDGMGFRRTHSYVPAHFYLRILNFLMVSFRYDIPRPS